MCMPVESQLLWVAGIKSDGCLVSSICSSEEDREKETWCFLEHFGSGQAYFGTVCSDADSRLTSDNINCVTIVLSDT